MASEKKIGQSNFDLTKMTTNGDETNANGERPNFVYRRLSPGSDNKAVRTSDCAHEPPSTTALSRKKSASTEANRIVRVVLKKTCRNCF